MYTLLPTFAERLRRGVHYLWMLRVNDINDPPRNLILSSSDHSQAARFRRSEDQHLCVMSRALVRLALSSHLPVVPGNWHFARGPNGRPYVTAPKISPQIWFSVSHTPGLIACLTTLSQEAGVDVERIDPLVDLNLLLDCVLSHRELESLGNCARDKRTKLFFKYWTLKEAYAKARGLGLGLPFHEIDFDINRESKISVRFGPQICDDPHSWVFWNSQPSMRHSVSVSIRNDCSMGCNIVSQIVRFDEDGLALAA